MWTTCRSRACPPPHGGRAWPGAFQDFFRFEFRAHQTVGLGDVPRIDDLRRGLPVRWIERARTM